MGSLKTIELVPGPFGMVEVKATCLPLGFEPFLILVQTGLALGSYSWSSLSFGSGFMSGTKWVLINEYTPWAASVSYLVVTNAGLQSHS